MKIEICTESDQLVIAFSGNLVKKSAQQILDELKVVLAPPDFLSVRMDVGAVDQFDSTALAIILSTIQSISSRPLFIANAQGELQSVLKIASGSGLFSVIDT